MKKITIIAGVIMAAAIMAGCAAGKESVPADISESTATEQSPDISADAAATVNAQETKYFTKGVYYNYAKEAEDPPKTYFYVFSDDTYGYTSDGEHEGIGVPFDIVQADDTVRFSFGGAEETEDVLTVSSFENGIVTGAFDDGRELVFEPVEGADPDTFSAENFVNGPEDSVYHDANGWSIRYDATKFEINQEGPQVFIVYTGESAGTNMVTVTYTVESNAEDAIKALGEPYGDTATYSQGSFPGAEDVTGYWVSTPVDNEGSGAYMTAIGRDFLDGALIFELDGHMSGDEALDMQVSDEMANIIDSLTFD